MKRKEPKFKYRFVMLIDDNDLDNFMNEKIIEANHFSSKIYINTNGLSAFEFLKNLEVSDLPPETLFPEVIFIDINMPLMDGFQFIENLQLLNKDKFIYCKKVILTSSIYPEDQEKAKRISDEIVFLHKPLTEEMLATI